MKKRGYYHRLTEEQIDQIAERLQRASQKATESWKTIQEKDMLYPIEADEHWQALFLKYFYEEDLD